MNNGISINYQDQVGNRNPVLCGTYRKEEPSYMEIKRRLSEGFFFQSYLGEAWGFRLKLASRSIITVGARIAI